MGVFRARSQVFKRSPLFPVGKTCVSGAARLCLCASAGNGKRSLQNLCSGSGPGRQRHFSGSQRIAASPWTARSQGLQRSREIRLSHARVDHGDGTLPLQGIDAAFLRETVQQGDPGRMGFDRYGSMTAPPFRSHAAFPGKPPSTGHIQIMADMIAYPQRSEGA